MIRRSFEMVIHVSYDIRKGRVTIKRDGVTVYENVCSTIVLDTLDAAKVPYAYEELGHTPPYRKAMEWRNEPEKNYGPQPYDYEEDD